MENALNKILNEYNEKLDNNKKELSEALENKNPTIIKDLNDQRIKDLIILYLKFDSIAPVMAKYYETKEKIINSLFQKLGEGSFKDYDQDLTFKIQKATGRWIGYNDFEIIRTKKDKEEKKARLSKVKADLLGYDKEASGIIFKKDLQDFDKKLNNI